VAALVFPKIFFPSDNPTVGIISSLATFGVGYVMRPVGAIFLGRWADRNGRKNVLILSMLVMGCATFLIGLLPTYAQVGILAPTLL
jgi:MFS family permease